MNEKQKLKARVDARVKELEAQLARDKVQATEKAGQAKTSARAKLESIRDELRGGWENVTEDAARRLNRLLS